MTTDLAHKHRDYPFKLKPFAHQLECWEMSKDLKEFALFMEMGTGKSKVLIDTMAYLYDNGRIDGALIIAPKAVYRTWYNEDDEGYSGEIPDHMPEHVKYFAVYWDGMGKKRLPLYEYLFKTHDHLDILLINVEAFQNKDTRSCLAYQLAKKFLVTHKAIMIIDESTTIKNMGANRSKHTIQLGGAAKYRRIASGFPVTRNPLDLFGQCFFLSWHLLGFSNIWGFKNRYAIMQDMRLGMRSFKKIIGFQRVEELTNLLKGFSYRKLKDECLDLPPKLYQYREVELSKEQHKHYDEMRLMALTQLNGIQFTAAQAMVRLEKLHEITCGFMKDSSTGITVSLPNGRLEVLMETLEEVTGKVLIWGTYTHDIAAITKEIENVYGPGTVASFYGPTDADERERIKRDFQKPDHPLRFFVGNPSTGRFGMTLTQAKTVIYYSNSHNLEHRIQSEDRAHRIGQEDPVLYIDLVARGTVDERIIKSLRQKKDIGEQVMGDGFREWLK